MCADGVVAKPKHRVGLTVALATHTHVSHPITLTLPALAALEPDCNPHTHPTQVWETLDDGAEYTAIMPWRSRAQYNAFQNGRLFRLKPNRRFVRRRARCDVWVGVI